MGYNNSKAVQMELESTVRNNWQFKTTFKEWKQKFLDFKRDAKKESTAYLDLFYEVLDLVEWHSLVYSYDNATHSFNRHTQLLVAENIAQEIRARVGSCNNCYSDELVYNVLVADSRCGECGEWQTKQN